ncbi:RNA polymerase sigma factor [Sphingomonas sp.]|uniref:RNA polymerase sigma factor n=1 Tax=Sphingomonas sp. TaxID=28214 RepID=UPI0025F78881|nr:RNA polymerase sigma factor [Sphingomonas sp.]
MVGQADDPERLVPIARARAARALASGDPGGPLYEAYIRLSPALASFLKRRTGCDQAAQDLLQDVWLRVAHAADDRSIDNPDAFLQRVTGNLALDWLRRNRFRSTFYDAEADATAVATPAPDAERIYNARRAIDYLRIVVDELPEGRRKVFLLCRGEGLTAKEAGKRLGIAEKTVKHQLASAMAHIRERLVQAGLWP